MVGLIFLTSALCTVTSIIATGDLEVDLGEDTEHETLAEEKTSETTPSARKNKRK